MSVPVTFLVDQLAQGGAERHAVLLANAAGAWDYVIDLVHLKPTDTLRPLVARDRVPEVRCLGVRRWFDVGAARRFGRECQARDTRVVVSANPYSTFYAAAARELTGARYRLLSTFHTTYLQHWRERLPMPLFAWGMRSADALVYMADHQRRYWQQRGLWAARQTRIYNGVDTRQFTPEGPHATAPEHWNEGDFVVGVCAGLRPEKAHSDVLRAVARLRSDGLPARCLFIGDGPERAALERLARELGMEDGMTITGFQSDVRPWLRLCGATVLASVTETFSLAALESMALGIPAVMSDVGGAAEQVVHGTSGMLFEQGNVEQLARCLQTLTDPGARSAMGRAAREVVETRFSFEGMADGYRALVDELAALRPGS